MRTISVDVLKGSYVESSFKQSETFSVTSKLLPFLKGKDEYFIREVSSSKLFEGIRYFQTIP